MEECLSLPGVDPACSAGVRQVWVVNTSIYKCVRNMEHKLGALSKTILKRWKQCGIMGAVVSNENLPDVTQTDILNSQGQF